MGRILRLVLEDPVENDEMPSFKKLIERTMNADKFCDDSEILSEFQ